MADNYNPKIIFGGDSSGAINAVSRLKNELGGLESLAKKALTFGVGAATVSSLIATTKAVIDQGDALNKMSQKTGVAVEELSKLNYIADLSGVSNEALTKSLIAQAVGMTEAATGVGATADLYKKFDINVRNADGTMKTSGAVLAEWADKFQAMPDGVDKTNLAVDLFGKKLGAEMIPMLNLGAAGLKALGDEAESLGLVMGAELAKKSEEFNDNLERLEKLSNAVGMEIGNALIPSLNELASSFLSGKKAGLGFWESIGVMADGMVNLPFVIDSTREEIKLLKEELEEKKSRGSSFWDFGITAESIQKEIDTLEKRMVAYKAIQDKADGDGVLTAQQLAAKRINIEAQMQTKRAELVKLYGIAEGKVSADILDDDNKRVAAQIANAQKLKDSLTASWKASAKAASDAAAESQKLLDSAKDTRLSGADKAAAKRRSQLSPEEQQQQISSEFDTAASAAERSANLAKLAAFEGRTENAAKLAAQAAKDAERAAKLADQIDDPNAGANAIERATEAQAQAQEAQAKVKQNESAAARSKADETQLFIDKLNQQIAELQSKAAAIKVQANIDEAKGAIATLQAQLDNLKDKTITVTVNQVGSSDAPLAGASPTAPGTGQQFAYGGWTGPGSKWQPAGLVHADEFVLRQEVVRQSGAKSFLAYFNQVGMRALQGYANGGLVQNLRMPSIASPARAQASASATFNFPGMGSFPVTMQPSVMGELTTAFQREALKRGVRR